MNMVATGPFQYSCQQECQARQDSSSSEIRTNVKSRLHPHASIVVAVTVVAEVRCCCLQL